MSKYHITVCPACGKGKLKDVRWNDGICGSGSDKYLDQDLYLTCAGCNSKELIFNLYFKCDYHDDFRKINMDSFTISLQSLSRSSFIPTDILSKMLRKAAEFYS
jgi:hypothetical protein